MKKIMALAMVFVLVSALFFGCGAVAKDSVAENGNYGSSVEIQDQLSGGSFTDQSQSNSGSADTAASYQKLVRKMWLTAETEDLDALLVGIDSRIRDLGGYVEARSVNNGSAKSVSRYRNAELTVRIPAEKLSAFVEHVTENSNIISSNETADDITLTYTATESRVKALETEQTRLLELLTQAQSMSEVLEIEKRLTEVRTQLEQVTSQLRLYENQVSYGTVYLTVREVKEYTDTTQPETVWQRIGKGLKESFKNLGEFFTEAFVLIVVGLPYIVLLGAVVVALFFVWKLRRKKKQVKQQEETE